MVEEQQDVLNQLRTIVDIYIGSGNEIRPHFMITGPSGSGKSHIVKQLSDEKNISFFEINAAQLTKEGTAGNSLSKSLQPLVNNGGQSIICFVDEFDKLFISGNENDQLAHETTNGVQNEFLKVLESKTTAVFGDYGKYIDVNVENVLFCFAGAFNGETGITTDRLREFGLKTEFLGRVGLLYELKKISLNSMHGILQSSEYLDMYLKLYPNFNKEQVIETVMNALSIVHENNTLGIRIINNMLNHFFITGGAGVEQLSQRAFQKPPIKFEGEYKK